MTDSIERDDRSVGRGHVVSTVGQLRIPMVVLGGWLGAGKTTLVNRLLGTISGERIAVVVNDIGEVNVDAELVASQGCDTIELTNGCVCCVIGDSLALTLRDLVLSDRPPDRIVVEASGIAQPDRVAAYGDRRRIRPDGIVVAVDATDVLDRAQDPSYGPLVTCQATAADLLVVTKADLLAERVGAGAIGVDSVIAWCNAVAPETPVVVADFDQVDDWIGALLGSPTVDRAPELLAETEVWVGVSDLVEVPVVTRSWRASGQVDLERLLEAIRGLRASVGVGFLRAKAVVEVLDGSLVVVHLAAGRVAAELALPGAGSHGAAGTLVAVFSRKALESSSPQVIRSLSALKQVLEGSHASVG